MMRLLIVLLVMLSVPGANTGAAKTRAMSSSPQHLELSLEAGSAHVVRHTKVKQVAVGNSQLIQANSASASEVILFAKQPGVTTVDIWTHTGEHMAYRVTISAAGLQHRLQQVRAVLAPLRGIVAQIAGEHIVVNGNEVSSEDRKQLLELLKRFPDVVDLTSPIAWDRMIMLDVRVLELPSHHLKEIGVRLNQSPLSNLHAGAQWSVGTARLVPDRDTAFTTPSSGAILGMSELLSARLHSLIQSGQAVLLAQPQLLARSGSPASFLAGGEVPYAWVDSEGKKTTLFKKYGVLLNVTPQIDRHGSIRAKVDVEVSAIDPSIQTEAGPAMRVRKASTEFNVKSGQTLVLGGFVSHEKVTAREGLMDVMNQRERQVELAIFVTPVIVTPDHPDMLARTTRAQTIEDWELGSGRQINLPLSADPDARTHRWHPAHPSLSQWGQDLGSEPTNTFDFDSQP